MKKITDAIEFEAALRDVQEVVRQIVILENKRQAILTSLLDVWNRRLREKPEEQKAKGGAE